VADLLLELPELYRDGRLRQIELRSRLGQRARVCYRPEVAQMVVVEVRHGPDDDDE
jgi:hypothetical protein